MALQILEGLVPSDLGFDSNEFPEYRRNPATDEEVQLEAMEFALTCMKRFAAMCIPPGIGKSVMAMSLAKYTGLRTVILTATKSLQEQYISCFQKYGLVDIRGRSNYQCVDYSHLNCKSGASLGCACVNGHGCVYETAQHKAKNADIITANYAYWMTVNDKASGLERNETEAQWKGENPVELLILDEADIADGLLSGYLSTKIFERELKDYVKDCRVVGELMPEWKEISTNACVKIESEIGEEKLRLVKLGKHNITRKDTDKLHYLEQLLQKFERISTANSDDWIVEKHEGTRYGRLWDFDVIWPGKYSERYLFCKVPRVVVMSGTLRPKTMGLLGVKNTDFAFKEWDRVFAANRNPIYIFPATKKDAEGKLHEIRIDRRTNESDLDAWVNHIDWIIESRLDRKGIIQTVSYDRQKFITGNSKFSDLMLGNTSDPDSDTAFEVAQKFRAAQAPAVLVSPSFARGWDFPMDQCEYIIICKIPFKPGHTKIAKARENRDKLYGPYIAMQELIQSCFRGMRSFGDRCEIFVVDGHVTWFLYQNQILANRWFVKAVRKINSIPKLPPKL